MNGVKLCYWVSKLPWLSWENFVSHWTTTHAELVQTMPGLRGYSINIASPQQRGPRPYDGYAMLRFDDRDAAKAAWASPAGVATAKDGEEFMARPPALMVAEHVVVPSHRGAGPTMSMKICYLVSKLPSISWDEFVRHWTTTHAELATALPGLRGYSINIASPQQRGPRPFDGYAMLRFDDRHAAKTAWASRAGVATAKDGQGFMARPLALVVDERVVVGPDGSLEGGKS